MLKVTGNGLESNYLAPGINVHKWTAYISNYNIPILIKCCLIFYVFEVCPVNSNEYVFCICI